MKIILFTLSLFTLTGCMTETRYSNHMIGNNINTATPTNKKDNLQMITSDSYCDDCQLIRPF